MINNYWEELKMNNIGDIHEAKISEMEIPKWMNLKCPFCSKEQPLRSIRSFGIKLNSRNIGDLFVELCCYDCKKLDTIYFRSEIETVKDFIKYINGEKVPKSKPIIEEDMYALRYNNLIEWSLVKSKK